MSKKSNDDVVFLLNFFFKKREELLLPFLEKNAELIGKTFRYEGNQPAFDLVRSGFYTLWIDKHIQQISSKDFPDSLVSKALSLISAYIGRKSIVNNPDIAHILLNEKMLIINQWLEIENRNMEKWNAIKYSYEKDKALIEREFRKYEQKMKEL